MRRTPVGLLIALTCCSAALGLRQTLSALPENRPSFELKLARYDALRAPLRTVRHAYLKLNPTEQPGPGDRLYRAQYALAPTVLHLASSPAAAPIGSNNADTYVIFDYRRARDLEKALDDHRRAAAAIGFETEVITSDAGVALVIQRRHAK